MIVLSAQTKIYLSISPTDMRKGFDGLCGLVADTLQQDPLSGALFLFTNRRRDRMKVLYWDGDGLAIWYRRLEQGTFQIPAVDMGLKTLEMRSDEFTMLLRGIDFQKIVRRKRYRLAS